MMKDDALGFDRCGHNATSAAFCQCRLVCAMSSCRQLRSLSECTE